MNLDKIIEDKEEFLNSLKQIRKDMNDAKAEVEFTKTAYENGFNAFKDGIKMIASEDHPIMLTFPQTVVPNIFYKYNNKLYVCIAEGICVEDNFDQLMTSWELEEE